MAKKTKKRLGFGPMGILVIILLVLSGLGLNLLGGGFGSGNPSTTVQNDSSSVEVGNDVESTVINITVSGSNIHWNGEEIEASELAERVNSQDDKTTYIVTDDKAIKASYDQVIEELNKAQVEFQESETQ
ncbi:hypothetical protein ACF3NG_05340 [Aerococcaceae bacterium WGS1372]